MSFRRQPAAGAAPLAFGERFARNQALGAAGLGLYAAMTGVAEPHLLSLLAVGGVLLLSYWFRGRAIAHEQRRRETLEDERDQRFLARRDRMFRSVSSGWMVGLAVAMALPGVRAVVLAVDLRLTGLLLVGVVVANLAGHLTVALACARDR